MLLLSSHKYIIMSSFAEPQSSNQNSMTAPFTIDEEAFFPDMDSLREWHRLAPALYKETGETYMSLEQKKRYERLQRTKKKIVKKKFDIAGVASAAKEDTCKNMIRVTILCANWKGN